MDALAGLAGLGDAAGQRDKSWARLLKEIQTGRELRLVDKCLLATAHRRKRGGPVPAYSIANR